ncbi:MAG: helix-turn-helix domain-containing protein [Anaerolineae bacterium]|nr:helix-turn-helix domain-containing protein [Anaerolineae bacterium]
MVSKLNPQLNFVPREEYVVDDLDTLKVLADPLRLRIRELMLEATTVKQVAAALDLPPTKLYYHINLLEKHKLIVLVDTRVVSGIIEKHYQVAAQHVRVAKHLLSGGEDNNTEGLSIVVDTFFETARDDLHQAVNDGAVEWDDEGERHKGLSLNTGSVQLTEAQAMDFYHEVEELFDRYHALSDAQKSEPNLRPYRTFYVLFPRGNKKDKSE